MYVSKKANMIAGFTNPVSIEQLTHKLSWLENSGGQITTKTDFSNS